VIDTSTPRWVGASNATTITVDWRDMFADPIEDFTYGVVDAFRQFVKFAICLLTPRFVSRTRHARRPCQEVFSAPQRRGRRRVSR